MTLEYRYFVKNNCCKWKWKNIWAHILKHEALYQPPTLDFDIFSSLSEYQQKTLWQFKRSDALRMSEDAHWAVSCIAPLLHHTAATWQSLLQPLGLAFHYVLLPDFLCSFFWDWICIYYAHNASPGQFILGFDPFLDTVCCWSHFPFRCTVEGWCSGWMDDHYLISVQRTSGLTWQTRQTNAHAWASSSAAMLWWTSAS